MSVGLYGATVLHVGTMVNTPLCEHLLVCVLFVPFLLPCFLGHFRRPYIYCFHFRYSYDFMFVLLPKGKAINRDVSSPVCICVCMYVCI